jgi:hypothetical protein
MQRETSVLLGLLLSIFLSSITAGICVFIGLSILNWLDFSSWLEPWHEMGWWGLAALAGASAGLTFWNTSKTLN